MNKVQASNLIEAISRLTAAIEKLAPPLNEPYLGQFDDEAPLTFNKNIGIGSKAGKAKKTHKKVYVGDGFGMVWSPQKYQELLDDQTEDKDSQ